MMFVNVWHLVVWLLYLVVFKSVSCNGPSRLYRICLDTSRLSLSMPDDVMLQLVVLKPVGCNPSGCFPFLPPFAPDC